DECFDPGSDVDEIEFLLHRDPSTPKISEGPDIKLNGSLQPIKDDSQDV
ncbi:hypothetical protein Tco_0721455, partial [Tanacetum coccineum]